jgi:hypothetical protein
VLHLPQGNATLNCFDDPQMALLKFKFTPTRTVLVPTNRNPTQNSWTQNIGQSRIILKVLLDELPVALLAMLVGGSRPHPGVIVNELSVEKNDQLIEEVPKRIWVRRTPRAAGRKPKTTLARSVYVSILDALAGVWLEALRCIVGERFYEGVCPWKNQFALNTRTDSAG